MKFVEVINAFNVSVIEHLKKNKRKSCENTILVLTSPHHTKQAIK